MIPGKEHFQSLRVLLRQAEFRRFRAQHRTNRWADFLGFTPSGDLMVGFWDGNNEPMKFEPDVIDWSSLVIYI